MKQRSGVVEATWAMILPTKAANCGVEALAAVGVHSGRPTIKSTTLHTQCAGRQRNGALSAFRL